VETYDPAKVGPRISWGRSHSVYHYGDSEVIRIPRIEAWVLRDLKGRLERDMLVCKRYLGEYMLDTRIVRHPDNGAIATIQPYAAGHYLSKEDMRDMEIKRQFKDFLARLDLMIRDGHETIDLMGQGGVLQRKLSNIMVLDDKKLRLFDAVIADTFGLRFGHWLFNFGKKYLLLRRQNSTIQYLLA